MKTSDILSADLLDVLFDGRNKTYGAYDLRKTYNKRINMALAGTVLVCLLFIAGSIFAHSHKAQKIDLVGPDILLDKIKTEELPKPELPPPTPPKLPTPQVAMASFTPPVITPNEDVPEDNVLKDMSDLQDIRIGNVDRTGEINDNIAPPVEKSISNATEIKKADDIDVFHSVEIPAEFNGGVEAWRKYLERNLNNELPVDNGAPQGKYTVVVSFIVDKDGAISDVKAENDPGYGTKAEAIRVIQKGPNWKPAQQNGRAVVYRHKQSITFTVTEQ